MRGLRNYRADDNIILSLITESGDHQLQRFPTIESAEDAAETAAKVMCMVVGYELVWLGCFRITDHTTAYEVGDLLGMQGGDGYDEWAHPRAVEWWRDHPEAFR